MDLPSNLKGNFSQLNSLNDWLKTAFLRLIVEETGLEVKQHDQAALDAKIFSRMKAQKISFPEEYYQLLASKTIEGRQEWQNLVLLLTNPESFFFRDKGHFKLLENYIVPDLIQQNQKSRTIRVCSAGCSTGEEAYSLAILLKELIPDADQWDLLILGLDVNSLSLEKAKAGIYRPWSFRTVAPEIKRRYFQMINGEYHIDPEIKQMVKFQTSNLVKDSFPRINSEMRDMDLIVCRNVFIYFEKLAIAKVLEKFYKTLKPWAYLLTGHTELYAQNLSKFESKLLPEGMVYQRLNNRSSTLSKSADQLQDLTSDDIGEEIEDSKAQENSSLTSNIQDLENFPYLYKIKSRLAHADAMKAKYNTPFNEKRLLRNAEVLMQKRAYSLAISQVESALGINSKNFRSCYLMAQLLNHLDDLERATYFCHQALEIDAFSISPYYVLASIAEKQKELSETKRILKKIIYLEPGSVIAYLKLSHIYQAENDIERTRKMQNVALKILKQLPAKMEILELDHLTVDQLTLQLETILGTN